MLSLGTNQGCPRASVDSVFGRTKLSLKLRRDATLAGASARGATRCSVSLQSAWGRVLGLGRVQANVSYSAGSACPSLTARVQSRSLRFAASRGDAGTWKAQAAVALGTLAWD